MKTSIKLLLLLTIFTINCSETAPTGSEDVYEYESAVFVIQSKQVTNNTFFAEGTIRNTGSETFSPTWYMEAQFYTDPQKSIKLGGSIDSFNFSLEPGETTQWSLTYSNSEQNLDNYPDFSMDNLRAYKRTN